MLLGRVNLPERISYLNKAKAIRIKLQHISIISLVLAFAALPLLPTRVFAAVSNPVPSAKVSFTFDDGFSSTITAAAPTLAKYGFTGTSYVVTGCVGMVTAPNTCRANTDATYMNWTQVKQLKTTYGWEIGSHTQTHPYLASKDAGDGQPNVLTPQEVMQQLVGSRTTLANQRIAATSMATPYGDYNAPVLAQIAKYYGSMRGFADIGYNTWPYSDYLIRDQQVQAGVTVAKVKSYIDTAIANKQWLVLTFHDIKTNASTNPDDYEYRTADLDAIAAYVKSKNLPVVNPGSALVTSDVNLLTNGSFNSGIAGGWTTDSTTITKDTGTNGSFPDPTNAAKLVATTRAAHLFSPKVTVSPNTTYVLKNYINVTSLNSGEVSFYIDEYNSAGVWVSGQYKAGSRAKWADAVNFSYKPSSADVATASLQLAVGANTGITAYFDNAQWFPVSTTSLPNLMANSNFNGGIASGWTTDSASTFTKDTASNGSPANPVYSIKTVSTSQNTHLFSPKITVDATKSYALSSYINIKQRTSGEIGIYIDEYDANGAWVSGQYKTGIGTIGVTTSMFDYTPSSTSVKKASLQFVNTAGSGIIAYLDNVTWY